MISLVVKLKLFALLDILLATVVLPPFNAVTASRHNLNRSHFSITKIIVTSHLASSFGLDKPKVV